DQPHMASTHYFPLVIHNYTMHYERHDKRAFLFHSDEFYLQQIKAGNMHPKELALLYDFPYRGIVPKPDPSKGEKFFRIGISFPGANSDRENKHDGVADEEINKYRAPFYIAPIEND